MPLTDEASRRREGCDFSPDEAVAVRLADGQDWHLPKPWLQIHAVFAGGQPADTAPRLTYGPELDALVQAIGESHDAAAVLVGAAALGAYLLRLHYELSDDELSELFAFRAGEPESWDWARQVMDVATGRSGPKRGRGGAS